MSLLDGVFAQAEDPTLEPEIDYVFGQELRFSLSVRNASDVERITLYFRPELATELYVVNVPFESAETLSVTHPIDLSLVKVRPYSRINYEWEVVPAGRPPLSLEQSFAYEDDRFVWHSTSRGGAKAHWTGGGPSLGQDALDAITPALARLSNILPVELISPFDVYIYPSSADLRAGLRLVGFDGEVTTHPELNVILVTAVNPQSAAADLGQSIPYELTHLLLYRVAGGKYDGIPWWLTEGLGLKVQARPHPDYAEILDDAVRSDSTFPFSQLCLAAMEKGDRVLLAEAQSASFVDFILNRYGDQAVAELISSYADGVECESAVLQTLGITLDDLQEAWLDSQRARSVTGQFFAQFGLWFLIILVSLGLTGLLIWYTTRDRKWE